MCGHRTVFTLAATSAIRVPNGQPLYIHFISFCEHSVTAATPRTAGVIVFVSCLKNFTSDIFLTLFTLDSVLNLVVFLTIWNTILADVFSAQYSLADFALEAAEVPLSSQSYQRLAILDVSAAAIAIAGVLWVVICRRRWSKASLADTVFPTECDTVSSRKGLFANGAHEAARMVALPQNCHHFSFHKLPAVVAGRAVEPLEVKWTEAVPVLHEEASPSQVTATHLACEALDVEVTLLNS